MLKTLNMAQICCPVGFYEEINAAFHMRKIQNYHRKYKKPKIPNFYCSIASFVNFLLDIVD